MNWLKRYKHVIYIKECRFSAIVQYKQHILQRIRKWEEKRVENVYKLGELGNRLPFLRTLSSYSQSDRGRRRWLL